MSAFPEDHTSAKQTSGLTDLSSSYAAIVSQCPYRKSSAFLPTIRNSLMVSLFPLSSNSSGSLDISRRTYHGTDHPISRALLSSCQRRYVASVPLRSVSKIKGLYLNSGRLFGTWHGVQLKQTIVGGLVIWSTCF